jgi:hypothetical protein
MDFEICLTAVFCFLLSSNPLLFFVLFSWLHFNTDILYTITFYLENNGNMVFSEKDIDLDKQIISFSSMND